MEVTETVKSFGLQEELKGSRGPSLDQGSFTLLFSFINPFPFIPKVVSRTDILLYFYIASLSFYHPDQSTLILKVRLSHFFYLVDCRSTLTSVIATVYGTRSLDTCYEPDIQRTSFSRIP